MSDLFYIAYKVGRCHVRGGWNMRYGHQGKCENSKREQSSGPAMEARQDALTTIPAINSPIMLAPAHARIVALGIP